MSAGPDPERHLAPHAARAATSLGRRHPEDEHGYRGPYQRDRDRIIHSRAFRRLEYKTQVFVNHEGDHFRTRLTHSIEVSQIGRTVARALALNEDLVESLALCHDLGHTPFGHLGEDVLSERLQDHGGFDHNRQTLRIVEHLEDRYPTFPGLNLTWEVREGIAKHSGPIDLDRAPEFEPYRPDLRPPLEAQMIDLVDEIAYNHHDIDDGLESGLITVEALCAEVPLFREPMERARETYPEADARQLRTQALRGLIDRLVSDLIETTRDRVRDECVHDLDAVREAPTLVGLSEGVARDNRVLKAFLMERLYHHPRLERMKDKSRRILEALFDRYVENPKLLPHDFRERIEERGLHRTVGDWIAGMTDRFVTEEYLRLFDPTVRV